ncbi:universal stress protein [Nocardia lijiangensis]|uniref:universal stress protein n=1 Tax=Nocardia lijiangensis TaxID=299618 RepID=UPI0008362667|nr:universal stress protein [Nocardia lijiangensis]
MTENTFRADAGDRPVLVAVDGSASSYQAAAWAAVDAATHGARLHVLTSVALIGGLGPAMSLPEAEMTWLRTDGQRIVTEAARIAREAVQDAELDLTTEVTFDLPIPSLIERSKTLRTLVVGSRGLGAFQRGLLGSVSTAVARHAHCPVTVVHDRSATDAVTLTKPVLVGVDGSENSVAAVEYAFDQAARRKVELVALHAWRDSSSIDLSVADWDSIRESERALLAERLAGFAERYPDVTVRRIVVSDRPVRALLEASTDAQLVVVGSHGRGGFSGMLLGSTSNALLHVVECPIVVIRQR